MGDDAPGRVGDDEPRCRSVGDWEPFRESMGDVAVPWRAIGEDGPCLIGEADPDFLSNGEAPPRAEGEVEPGRRLVGDPKSFLGDRLGVKGVRPGPGYSEVNGASSKDPR
jgi:hypothetical protein